MLSARLHNRFLKNSLINSERGFRNLQRFRLIKITLKLILGYLSYTLPILIGILFFKSQWGNDEISDSAYYLCLFLIFITIIPAALFYIILKDDILTKRRHLLDTYDKYYVNHSVETVLNNKPFILYARNFKDEHNLGNEDLSGDMKDMMDNETDFSFIPLSLTDIADTHNLPLLGLGHSRVYRNLFPVQLLFCKDEVWEEVFFKLAQKADLLVLNTLEKHGDYFLKSSEGLKIEMDLIIANRSIQEKTLVLHNEFERPPLEGTALGNLLSKAKWSASFNMHDKKTHEFIRPTGEIPEGVLKLIEKCT